MAPWRRSSAAAVQEGAIGNAQLAAGAVGTAQIQNGAVTTEKLAFFAVNSQQLALKQCSLRIICRARLRFIHRDT